MESQCQSHENTSHSAMDPTIHILGIGNIGKLFAHSLAIKSERPSLTLLLHRNPPEEMQVTPQRLCISIKHDGAWHKQDSYNWEFISENGQQKCSYARSISNLIVTTKTHKTVKALSMIKHRLTPTSTVLFIHNGMGVIEDVNGLVFPKVQDRPHYLFGIASHGVYSENPSKAVLAGHGSVIIGNPEIDQGGISASSYLLRQIVDSELLRASEAPWAEFKLLQLQKLAVNAVINPLTALNNCLNGKIAECSSRGDTGNVLECLVSEISQVYCSLPELQGISDIKERFSIENIRNNVIKVASTTAQNRSSMLQDLTAGNETEVLSINGYIAKRGRELGIECPINEKMVLEILAAIETNELRETSNEAERML